MAEHELKMRGFGPKSIEWLARAGIVTTEELMQADPYALYATLRELEPKVSLNMLYAILGAQEGRHWQEIARERKTEILMRLDDLGIAPR